MSQHPPLRNRPNLHLALTQLNGSPRHHGQATPTTTSLSAPSRSPAETPFGKTAYSPFRSAGLKPPTPYGGPISFAPRRSDRSLYGNYNWFRIKRAFASKPILLVLMVFALIIWWFNGGSAEIDVVKLSASGFGKEFLNERRMHDYQFYPATNPKIHVRSSIILLHSPRLNQFSMLGDGHLLRIGFARMGPFRVFRSTPATYNGELIDFCPGVYFDITIKNTSSLLLSLHNVPEPEASPTGTTFTLMPTTLGYHDHRHFHFHSLSNNEKPAPPVSLLARVDDQEYILLPNASSLVSVRSNDLDTNTVHHVRVIAPMIDDHGTGVVELAGVWLTKGGKLVKVAGSPLGEEYVDEDLLKAENDLIGERHRSGLAKINKDSDFPTSPQIAKDDDENVLDETQDLKKVLEIITDSPGSFAKKQRGKRTGGADGLMAGVMGWEYLLGEMFGVDHVRIGVDGMCLTQDCIGGTGNPAGMGDVFFRRYVVCILCLSCYNLD